MDPILEEKSIPGLMEEMSQLKESHTVECNEIAKNFLLENEKCNRLITMVEELKLKNEELSGIKKQIETPGVVVGWKCTPPGANAERDWINNCYMLECERNYNLQCQLGVLRSTVHQLQSIMQGEKLEVNGETLVENMNLKKQVVELNQKICKLQQEMKEKDAKENILTSNIAALTSQNEVLEENLLKLNSREEEKKETEGVSDNTNVIDLCLDVRKVNTTTTINERGKTMQNCDSGIEVGPKSQQYSAIDKSSSALQEGSRIEKSSKSSLLQLPDTLEVSVNVNDMINDKVLPTSLKNIPLTAKTSSQNNLSLTKLASRKQARITSSHKNLSLSKSSVRSVQLQQKSCSQRQQIPSTVSPSSFPNAPRRIPSLKSVVPPIAGGSVSPKLPCGKRIGGGGRKIKL